MAEMTIEDANGKRIKATWFHQAYMAKKVLPGTTISLTGTVTDRKGQLYLANPILNDTAEIPPGPLLGGLTSKSNTDGELTPIYPETRGLSSLWFYGHITQLLKPEILESMTDPIPADILKKYNLPKLATALVWIHTPKKSSDAEAARKRFAFEEIFFIQLSRMQLKHAYQSHGTYSLLVKKESLDLFFKRFPFAPTNAQLRATNEIIADLSRSEPMMRLLEGDVGSGKTFVAAAASFATISNPPKDRKAGNLQVAYMAPTEILAKQHFESFIEYFKHLPIQIGLITGTECKKFPSKIDPSGSTHISRAQLLKWVANGEIPILIGTHALIQKTVRFKNLALVIIDEQHRFGTMQRGKLTKKDLIVPHLLSMTATPIPRTLALTIYGDLDLSLLDEQPAGRKPINTQIVAPGERTNVYNAVKTVLEAGRQAYVICPRIDEPDPTKEMALQAKSAVVEVSRLKKEIFPEFEIGLVHSKLKPVDKEEVMRQFTAHEIDVLVATSVVEVGVNVPNATIILIEGAERFGLAQLHQLRGRVLRSTHQAHCYLFTETKSKTSTERLQALITAKNGFGLAELDLKLRGPGALSGTKQWGITDLGMEAIKNLKMVEAARTEARIILKKDPGLINYPTIRECLTQSSEQVHLE